MGADEDLERVGAGGTPQTRGVVLARPGVLRMFDIDVGDGERVEITADAWAQRIVVTDGPLTRKRRRPRRHRSRSADSVGEGAPKVGATGRGVAMVRNDATPPAGQTPWDAQAADQLRSTWELTGHGRDDVSNVHVATGTVGFACIRRLLAPDDVTLERVLDFARLLGDVRPQTDGSATQWLNQGSSDWHLAQPLHTDAGHLLVLVCRDAPPTGGATLLCSAAHIGQLLRDDRPALTTLSEPFAFHRGGWPGPATFERPILTTSTTGEIGIFLLPNNVRQATSYGADPLRPDQRRALDLLDQITSDPANRCTTALAPGDALVVRNSWVLHGREPFPREMNRRLVRAWIDVPEEKVGT